MNDNDMTPFQRAVRLADQAERKLSADSPATSIARVADTWANIAMTTRAALNGRLTVGEMLPPEPEKSVSQTAAEAFAYYADAPERITPKVDEVAEVADRRARQEGKIVINAPYLSPTVTESLVRCVQHGQRLAHHRGLPGGGVRVLHTGVWNLDVTGGAE